MTRWLGSSLGLWSTLALAQDLPALRRVVSADPTAAAADAASPLAAPAAPSQPAPSQPLPVEPEAPGEDGTEGSAAPAPPASSLLPVSAITPELTTALNLYIDNALAAFHVPGAAVAVLQGGQIAYIGTFGVREAGEEAPVDADTRFMIGSVSKSLTTTLAASLVAEGRIGWEDRLSDYLPGFQLSNPEWSGLVTLSDAFGHTSGVPRSDIELLMSYAPPLGLLERIAALPAQAEPGVRYEYHNQMFSIGGFALARALGVPLGNAALAGGYTRLMQRRVFNPLGMARTTLDFEQAAAEPDHALPHAYDAEALGVRPLPLGVERAFMQVAPAGAIWSSVSDMARYFAMQLREGESLDGVRVVPQTELLETHAPRALVQEGLSYGLGWLTAETAGAGPLLTHDGGTVGFNARLFGFPALDFGVVVLVNRSGATGFMEAVTRYVLELGFAAPHAGDADLLELDAQSELAAGELLAVTAPVEPAAVEGYLGRYEQHLRVRQSGEELLISNAYGELRYRAVAGAEDVFLCVDHAFLGLAAEFSADEAGNVTLRLGLPDFEAGELIQPLAVQRLAHASGHHRRHPRFDFRRLPLPHRSSPLHLEPLAQHPYGAR